MLDLGLRHIKNKLFLITYSFHSSKVLKLGVGNMIPLLCYVDAGMNSVASLQGNIIPTMDCVNPGLIFPSNNLTLSVPG